MVTGGVLYNLGARPGVSGIWGRGLFDCGYRGVQLFLGTKESESRIRIRIQNPNPNLESGIEILAH